MKNPNAWAKLEPLSNYFNLTEIHKDIYTFGILDSENSNSSHPSINVDFMPTGIYICIPFCLFVCNRGHWSKCRWAPSPDSAREQGATSRELGQSPMPVSHSEFCDRNLTRLLVLGYV